MFTFFAAEKSKNKANGRSLNFSRSVTAFISGIKNSYKILKYDFVPKSGIFAWEIGNKVYELKDHLGNVRSLIADYRAADGSGNPIAALEHYAHYYPFGMQHPGRNGNRYRFGFNQGSEKVDEITGVTGSHYTTFYRELDTRIAHWWTPDPKSSLTPWESPYVSMANNPIWYNDPLGDIVDGDEDGKENYKNYRKENNARITSLQDKMKGLDKSSDEYSKLNEQLQSYNQINTELDALEADQENLYYINSDVTFEESSGDGQTEGKTYFKGMTTYEGKEMKQINIDLASKMFPMSNMAHEFKHAHQYYEGRLIFIAGSQGGFNSKELEHEAFERGGRFSGNLQINNKRFKENYKYKPVFKTENYKNLPEKVNAMTNENHKIVDEYWKKRGKELIYNLPK